MKLRKQFIEEHLDQNHDSFTTLCDGYGISRKTGYKWVDRFMNSGLIILLIEVVPHKHPQSNT